MRTTLVTLSLSAAAVLGYLTYRAVILDPDPAPAGATMSAEFVDRLPEFTLQNLDGEPRSSLSWPGKALLLNFWATWCPPCLREIPLLKEFQRQNGGRDIQVVGIAVDRLEPVVGFAEEMNFNYPILIGQSEAMEAAAAFGVEFFGLPFSVVTDREGRVLSVHTGELHAEDLEQILTVLEQLDAGRIDVAAARARLAGRQ